MNKDNLQITSHGFLIYKDSNGEVKINLKEEELLEENTVGKTDVDHSNFGILVQKLLKILTTGQKIDLY